MQSVLWFTGFHFNLLIKENNLKWVNIDILSLIVSIKFIFLLIFQGNDGGGLGNTALAGITSLKKLCNHPDLLWDKIKNKDPGFEKLGDYFPPNYDPRWFLFWFFIYYPMNIILLIFYSNFDITFNLTFFLQQKT